MDWSGLKSGISVRELISTKKKEEEKKKSAGGEWIVEHSLSFLAHEEKATTTTSTRWRPLPLFCLSPDPYLVQATDAKLVGQLVS